MKNLGLLSILLLSVILLSGCHCNVSVNNCTSDDQTNEAKAICLENKGTYSRVTSPDEEHGECMFPSGIGCRDEMILEGECNWKANVDDIDTEEERFAQCEENVTSRLQDMAPETILNNVEYGEEQEERDEEGELTIINREFKAYYTKDGQNWILDGVCEANFVQGGMGTLFNQEYMEE